MVATALSWIILAALTWPLPLHPLTSTLDGLYHDGHVWCFQFMASLVFGGDSTTQARLGFPYEADLQFIGWGAALLVAPLQWILGPVGAYNASFYISAAANVFGMGTLLRILGARPWPAAAAALMLCFCPFSLEAISNGQIAKFQLWTLALHLLVVWWALQGWWRIFLVVPTSLLLAHTSPSLALSLPMLLVVFVPCFVWTATNKRTAAITGTGSIILTGLCMIWASSSYDLASQQSNPMTELQSGISSLLHDETSATSSGQAAFFPASVTPGDYRAIIDSPEAGWRRSWKVARIDTLFLGGDDIYADHVPYIGVLALLLGGFLSRRRFRFRWLGWTLTASGILFAFGPQLANSTSFVYIGGQTVPMPARLLDAVGYPVGSSGMYHRFLIQASMGLAILLACGTSVRQRHAARFAWIAAGIIIADGIIQSSDRWPRPSNPVRGIQALEAMARDNVPGAVVALPLRVNDTGAGSQLMLAAIHGRDSSGLLRYDSWDQDSTLQLRQWFDESNRGVDAADYLAIRGIRYLVWTPWVQHESGGPDLPALTGMFGAPYRTGELRWWKLEENATEAWRRAQNE